MRLFDAASKQAILFALIGALTSLLITPSLATALAFIGACALCGVKIVVERERTSEIDDLKKQIMTISNRVDGIVVGRIVR